jgi:pentatricopeptide repeat protein
MTGVLLLVVQMSCEPTAGVQAELQAAANVAVSDAMDFDRNIAPLSGLRARHPDDLFVHERYQDGVARHGIEGHVRAMVQEYQDRATQAPDDLVSRYLFARALIGRNTQAVIQALTQIVAEHPDFAPAHRALAAIYDTQMFHDEQKARAARERLQMLCHDSGSATATPWPVTLPPLSPLIDEAERLFAEDGKPDRVAAMALQGIKQDEWRLQRMRPFDWYTEDEKRQAQRELTATYWRLWTLQVRCYQKAGRLDEANQLLAQMERRRRAGVTASSR